MQENEDDTSGYIASLLLGEEPESLPQPLLHTMSLRLPMEMAAFVFELAITTDKSRVEMARLLVQAGIDSVLSRLPAEVANDIREAAHERLENMISED